MSHSRCILKKGRSELRVQIRKRSLECRKQQAYKQMLFKRWYQFKRSLHDSTSLLLDLLVNYGVISGNSGVYSELPGILSRHKSYPMLCSVYIYISHQPQQGFLRVFSLDHPLLGSNIESIPVYIILIYSLDIPLPDLSD